jgi:hypothetical protein
MKPRSSSQSSSAKFWSISTSPRASFVRQVEQTPARHEYGRSMPAFDAASSSLGPPTGIVKLRRRPSISTVTSAMPAAAPSWVLDTTVGAADAATASSVKCSE